MESDLGEVVACHLEDIVGIRQENVAAFFVGGHELMLPFLEGSESFFIVTLDPACFIKTDRLPTALRSIFMEQPVLYHLKLELTNSPDDFSPVKAVCEHLCHAFVHQLVDTFVKLLGFHRIGILDIFKHLRRERGQAFEMYKFARSQGVSDLEVAGVRDADYISGISFIDDAFFLRHECRGSSEFHHLVVAYMTIVDIPFEFSGTNFHECYT